MGGAEGTKKCSNYVTSYMGPPLSNLFEQSLKFVVLKSWAAFLFRWGPHPLQGESGHIWQIVHFLIDDDVTLRDITSLSRFLPANSIRTCFHLNVEEIWIVCLSLIVKLKNFERSILNGHFCAFFYSLSQQGEPSTVLCYVSLSQSRLHPFS